jgi:hypothetical protein
MPQGGTCDRADATSYPVDAPHGGNGFCGGNVPGGTNGPTLISAGRRCAGVVSLAPTNVMQVTCRTPRPGGGPRAAVSFSRMDRLF